MLELEKILIYNKLPNTKSIKGLFNEIELNKIRLNSYIKQPTNNTKLTNSLNFTGLFKNNLVEPTQVPPTLVADPRSKGMPPGANVRITLTLTKK